MMCFFRKLRKRSARYRLVDAICKMQEHISSTEKRLNQLENKKDVIDVIGDELKRIEQDQRIIDNLNRKRT